jgi:hypothetical protein
MKDKLLHTFFFAVALLAMYGLLKLAYINSTL